MYPPSPPRPSRRGPLIAAASAGGFLILIVTLLAVLGATVDDPAADPTPAAAARSSPAASRTSRSVAAVPAYRIVENRTKGVQRYITVELRAMPPKGGMRLVLEDIRRRHRQEAGYIVAINCATGGTKSADNRLANGRLAVGRRGAAGTGLRPGAMELEAVAGARCPG